MTTLELRYSLQRTQYYIMKIIATIKITLLVLFVNASLIAGEGMWLPQLIKALNEGEMQSMGMKITAEDIYSVNQGSLKDAIVHFGGFCTGEIISGSGLILTNHHCGYSNIQSHSTLEDNYLRDGFWAESYDEEKANPGLFVRFIDRIEDVTSAAMEGVTEAMDNKSRQSIIDTNLEMIKGTYEMGEFQELIIKPFYNGNQYYAFVTTVFNDVRLVGTPPESIGKFGADTDNWEWPRHTGDFSLFRVYASPDNQPANYSEDNIPYTPKHFLPVSLDGVEEGDFTMVFGFPGRTNQYLPSAAVEQIVEKLNPAKISIRENALEIIDKYMRDDEEIRLKYASKFARVANYWKKWIGESQGLVRTKAIQKKKDREALFNKRAAKKYQGLVGEFDKLYADNEELAFTRDYYSEVTSRNIELLRTVGITDRIIKAYEASGVDGYMGFKSRLVPFLEGFYKDYNSTIDKEVFNRLVEMYAEAVNPEYIPEQLAKAKKANSYSLLSAGIYTNSIFVDQDKLLLTLNGDPAEAVKTIKADPAYTLYKEWSTLYNEKVSAPYNANVSKIDSLQRIYMKAQMETFNDQRFYPDANSTMRITYGNVQGYEPRDAIYYKPVTYLDGVVAKYVPGDYEFDVNQKLLDLHASKDYGQYADSTGKVPVCFLGSNHTTGGNSGSPAIDAHGNLIGLNFDRVWEGTMSDINYDVSICRNIMVDARYILFVVDKYAGATRLIEEMSLVHPKKK